MMEHPEDYVGEDGLLYCGKCRTRKQYNPSFNGRVMIVGVPCKCEQERRQKEEEERKREEEIARIRRMKATCIHDKGLLDCMFVNDDGSVKQMKIARWYVNTWKERRSSNDGLLLWGTIGTGKTFFAGCIANALIEQGESVLMTNFSKILNTLSGMYSEEKNEFIASLMRYSLLIIDDLGIERNTEYAKEQVYNIIDERYKAKLPFIVTTNLTLDELKDSKELAYRRIYDRVLSMCVPVSFQGESHRKQEHVNRTQKVMKEIMNLED